MHPLPPELHLDHLAAEASRRTEHAHHLADLRPPRRRRWRWPGAAPTRRERTSAAAPGRCPEVTVRLP
ncbi:hypothetical protein FTX61_18755 [Nitriliruptoraceae bacterium ZYF776]|nr:hypothetical protein [Profundirhabdus halotolerans]